MWRRDGETRRRGDMILTLLASGEMRQLLHSLTDGLETQREREREREREVTHVTRMIIMRMTMIMISTATIATVITTTNQQHQCQLNVVSNQERGGKFLPKVV